MNLQNHFLIAMPALDNSFFERAVIYVCEHNDDGAMGIVINKPIGQFTVDSLLSKLKIYPSPKDPSKPLNKPVFAGGPVADDRGFILHTPCDAFSSSLNISSDIMVTTSKDVLDTIGTAEQPKEVLVALGYSGWEKGQLEKELMDNAWLTCEADAYIVFHTPIADRWQAAAKKLGIQNGNFTPHAGHA